MSENQNVVGGYELKNCVASGNTTQIWKVTQAGSTVPLAMKLLLPNFVKDVNAKNVLKHEYKVGMSFEHPTMIRYHKLELSRDHGFFIMDFFRAPSLKTQISANLYETQSRLKKIVESLCQAFVHMNEKGWLHRDIKPDNILVNKTGEVRVIDFSLAADRRQHDDAGRWQTEEYHGDSNLYRPGDYPEKNSNATIGHL